MLVSTVKTEHLSSSCLNCNLLSISLSLSFFCCCFLSVEVLSLSNLLSPQHSALPWEYFQFAVRLCLLQLLLPFEIAMFLIGNDFLVSKQVFLCFYVEQLLHFLDLLVMLQPSCWLTSLPLLQNQRKTLCLYTHPFNLH